MGLTQTLYRKGIPHVIGMRESILDRAGIQFAQAFFAGIAQQWHVARSLQAARLAITRPLAGLAVYRDGADDPLLAEVSLGQWCLPMLLSHDLARPLINWDFVAQPAQYAEVFTETLGRVSIAQHFVGRRRELTGQGLRLIVTSRWALPDWEGLHHGLGKPVYGDFLAFARQKNLPTAFMGNRERLHQAYHTLHGNFRGLEFFARAVENMSLEEEQHFIARLPDNWVYPVDWMVGNNSPSR